MSFAIVLSMKRLNYKYLFFLILQYPVVTDLWKHVVLVLKFVPNIDVRI